MAGGGGMVAGGVVRVKHWKEEDGEKERKREG